MTGGGEYENRDHDRRFVHKKRTPAEAGVLFSSVDVTYPLSSSLVNSVIAAGLYGPYIAFLKASLAFS